MSANPQRLLQHVRALVPSPVPEEAADAALLDRFLHSGDENAFSALVARHGPMVHGVCQRVLRDGGAAEDVAQAVFLVLARKARSIRRRETLAAWMYRTARHLALNYLRSQARRRQREARSLQAVPARTVMDPLDELSVRELLAIFDEEVGRLPERYRLPLILCCLEGCTQEEAARRLGWTAGSVKGRLERARARLHDRLVRRGLSLSAALVGLEAVSGGTSAAGFVVATTRTALLFAAGTGGIDADVSDEVAAIATEAVASTALSRARMLLSLLLMVGLVAAGLAAVSYQGSASKPPGEKQAAIATRPPDQPPEKQRPRTDRNGQPLPEGAIARLGTLLWRASGNVEDLAFAASGKMIAVGSRAGIDLFDLEGKSLKGIRAKNTSFSRLAFSPDSRQLICRCFVMEGGRFTRAVQLWDVTSQRRLQEFDLQAVQWVGWSASGEPLAVLLEKGAVVFRELIAGKDRRFEVKGLPAPATGLDSCAFAPVEKLLAFPDQKCTIHVWDVSTGIKRCALETRAHNIHSLTLSPDGRLLACWARTGDKVTARLWNLMTGKAGLAIATDQKYPRAVVFGPGGKTVAAIGGQDVRFHDVATGRERSRLRGTPFMPSVAFSPDGKTLAVGDGFGGTINLWDVRTGKLKTAEAGHLTAPAGIDFSPDGRRVVTIGSTDGTIFLWDPTTGEAVTRIRKGRILRGCFFSSDGRTLFSGMLGETLEHSDASTGRLLNTMKVDDPGRPKTRPWTMSMHPSDDRKSWVVFSHYYPLKGVAPSRREVLLTGWDATTQKLLFLRRRPWVDFGFAVSPDTRLLAVSQGGRSDTPEGVPGDGPIRIEDVVSGEHLLTLPQGKGQTQPLAFSPDNRLLITNTAGKTEYTSRVWETATAAELLTFPAIQNTRVAFSPDGRFLALTDRSQEILLWDLPGGKERQRFKGFGADVNILTFSPDGKRLVSGLSNSTLLVWEVATGSKTSKPVRLSDAGLAKLWADLGGNVRKAFPARATLALSSDKTLPLLRKRLKPVQPAESGQVRRLVAELDSDTFENREKARKELEQLGDRASGALEAALKSKPSLEAHRRIEALLKRLRPPIADGETLRSVRAVAVLEDIGSPEARKVLQSLTKGAAEARVTQEAKAALERLSRR
jgi:RNA polymerase sigma factor (sigma-70 family)